MRTIPNARTWHPDGWQDGVKLDVDAHGHIIAGRHGGTTDQRVLPALGDHEIGDNPWPNGSFELAAVPTFKKAWADTFTRTGAGGHRSIPRILHSGSGAHIMIVSSMAEDGAEATIDRATTAKSNAAKPATHSSGKRLPHAADIVIGCAGGGSNFAGLSFPFAADKLTGKQR